MIFSEYFVFLNVYEITQSIGEIKRINTIDTKDKTVRHSYLRFSRIYR